MVFPKDKSLVGRMLNKHLVFWEQGSRYFTVLAVYGDGNKSLYLVFVRVVFSQHLGLLLEQLGQHLELLLEQLGQ
jgi:hypothetical protein